MSDHHDCPGLIDCHSHPRWPVIKYGHRWEAWAPNSQTFRTFPTHAEAMSFADRKARE